MDNTQVHHAEVFRTLIQQGFNEGKVEDLADLVTPDFKEYEDGFDPPNLEGLKRSVADLRIAFPDLHLTVQRLLLDGEYLAALIFAEGTHAGPFFGLPPTGRRMRINVVDICRFSNGRIAEHWGVADRFRMLQQLGAMPVEEKT